MSAAVPALLLLDLGDVLARYDPAPRVREYASRSGSTEAEVIHRLVDSGFSQDCDRGRYSADEMHAEIEARLGCAFSREDLLRLQSAAFALRPELLAIAAAAASRCRVGILTNNSPLLEEAFPVHFPRLCSGFDPILFSWRFAAAKPQPELFEGVARQLGVAPGEILFIDDQARHVAAARRAGFRAVRFEDAAQLRRELLDAGLLDPGPLDPAGSSGATPAT